MGRLARSRHAAEHGQALIGCLEVAAGWRIGGTHHELLGVDLTDVPLVQGIAAQHVDGGLGGGDGSLEGQAHLVPVLVHQRRVPPATSAGHAGREGPTRRLEHQPRLREGPELLVHLLATAHHHAVLDLALHQMGLGVGAVSPGADVVSH